MGVMLQAFYWDCFARESVDGAWWPVVQARIPDLARAGFTTLWLPPAHKGAHIFGASSMGYDPFDYYDLGDLSQRGRETTCFGSRKALVELIGAAHKAGLSVLADIVVNHCSGGDAEQNPMLGRETYTRFMPKSGRFARDWRSFHPCTFETSDGMLFGDMPDLCHRNPIVAGQILDLCRWLVEEIGFDGFRYDMVKGYGAWMVSAIQEQRYQKEGREFRPFGVGEEWAGERSIEEWIHDVNAWSDNPASAFDFPLRFLLRDLCDQYGFSMRRLCDSGTFTQSQPFRSVTFVDNHDFRGGDSGNQIVSDKLLAYAYVLTHEGFPCVFWQDYFTYDLAREGTPHGIAALVDAHERYAGGPSQCLWVDDDLYIMQRAGHEANPGLIVAINNRGDGWRGSWVSTRWRDTTLRPIAWWSASTLDRPQDQPVFADGRAQIWAPPRGYAVYG